MRIVIAPDKFKGSLSAPEAASAIARGARRVLPTAEVVLCPVADGGEGTLDALMAATGGRLVSREVTGPLGSPLTAYFGYFEKNGRTAVVEMAAASGLQRVPEDQRDITLATTYGTGQLIAEALAEGAVRIIVGVGGSATCDGGLGAAQALGAKVLDSSGQEIGFGGTRMVDVAEVDIQSASRRLREAEILVACDVQNPFSGPEGAAHVYGPQKGATPEQVLELDRGLVHLAAVFKQQLGVDVTELPGAGAAGGLAGGLAAFFGSNLEPGAELILDIIGFRDKINAADLVITGEGRIDRQTAYGKAPAVVARLSKRLGLPVVAITGQKGRGFEAVFDQGIDNIAALADEADSVEEAINEAESLIEEVSEKVMRDFLRR